MNILQSEIGICENPRYGDPYCAGYWPRVPFFLVVVGGLTGNFDPIVRTDPAPQGYPYYFVPFLPEPSPVLLVGCALAILVPLRRFSTG